PERSGADRRERTRPDPPPAWRPPRATPEDEISGHRRSGRSPPERARTWWRSRGPAPRRRRGPPGGRAGPPAANPGPLWSDRRGDVDPVAVRIQDQRRPLTPRLIARLLDRPYATGPQRGHGGVAVGRVEPERDAVVDQLVVRLLLGDAEVGRPDPQ